MVPGGKIWSFIHGSPLTRNLQQKILKTKKTKKKYKKKIKTRIVIEIMKLNYKIFFF